jgi:hypothetical protein
MVDTVILLDVTDEDQQSQVALVTVFGHLGKLRGGALSVVDSGG